MVEPLIVRTITFDCADAPALARFWAALLGWHVYFDDDPEVMVAPSFPPADGPRAPVLLFIPVPEGKTAKNRVHLDLGSVGSSRDEQLARALALGASLHEDHRRENGTGWVTMTDPEGNEFCIERSEAERDPSSGPRTYRIEAQ